MPPTTDLRAELARTAPNHPFVDALQAGPGRSAAVEQQTSVRTMHGAVEVASTVVGPGEASATLLDIELEFGDLVVHSMRGGRFEATYPPKAYAPEQRTLHPRLPFPWAERLSTITLGSVDGRSSDNDMPFFLLTDVSGSVGLWVAIGWSGSWSARIVKRQDANRHHVVVTGPGSNLTLRADERVALPRVLVGAFVGDGWAAVRRFLEANCPRRIEPPVVYNSWFNESADITQDTLTANLKVAADIGVEVFVIDAGWYRTGAASGMDFETDGLGDWTVDVGKFPDGLAAFFGRVRAAGLIPGLWVEPERAHENSSLVQRHPDWTRPVPGTSFRLVDFGNESARAWAVELVCGLVEQLGLGWLKWDFNVQRPIDCWAGDERAELAHVNGLYQVLDDVLEHCPDLLLEACASGGNRVDVEMLQRAHSLWLSDQTISPDIVRATVANSCHLLPAQYRYLSVSPQCEQADVQWPDEWFVGVMPGVFGVMDRLREWPQARRAQAAAHIATYKRIRGLLDGDLRRWADPSPTPLTRWEALELSGPEGAALFAFRLGSTDEGRQFAGARDWDITLPMWGADVGIAD